MASTVNKPTDLKKKDADINRKLQLYGIYRAFKAGKAPSVSCVSPLCSAIARGQLWKLTTY